MTAFTNKVDFAVIFTVNKANPNGDPLSGNQPRIDFKGFGEVSDVCIKRKIRNRLQDMGENIFVQSDERSNDGFKSLSERASSARPEGSMEVCKVYWWKHNCLAGQYSSAKVHNSLKVEVKNDVDTPNCFEDFTITLSPLEDLEPEIYDGI